MSVLFLRGRSCRAIDVFGVGLALHEPAQRLDSSDTVHVTDHAIHCTDRWEPAEPSGHLLPLEELRNKIHQAQQEHASKGQVKVSGRTM